MAQYSDSDVLVELLGMLHERQTACPMCGGESVCEEGCMLEDRWFEPKKLDPRKMARLGWDPTPYTQRELKTKTWDSAHNDDTRE